MSKFTDVAGRINFLVAVRMIALVFYWLLVRVCPKLLKVSTLPCSPLHMQYAVHSIAASLFKASRRVRESQQDRVLYGVTEHRNDSPSPLPHCAG